MIGNSKDVTKFLGKRISFIETVGFSISPEFPSIPYNSKHSHSNWNIPIQQLRVCERVYAFGKIDKHLAVDK